MKSFTTPTRLSIAIGLMGVMLFVVPTRSANLHLIFPPEPTAISSSRQQGQPDRPSGPRLETNFVDRVTEGTLFENVTAVLLKRYYDQEFRKNVLPGLIKQYEDKARSATILAEQRNVVEEFLGNIPASHLGLLSRETHKYVMYDLTDRPYPMFGFQLIEQDKKLYAFAVLEGGPAATAGLLPWDRIVSIDGDEANQSPRLDFRSDDAYLKDDRDPPVHYLVTKAHDVIRVKIERHQGKFLELTIPAADYSAIEAAKNSARVFKRDGESIGYVHFWYVHITGVPELLKQKFEGDFADCNGLVVDLRGRGGSGMAISKIVEVLQQDVARRNRPIVALIDRHSRSAKDVLAYELKTRKVATLVGEPTAGAVIPASFADVGHDTILMFPSFKMKPYTDLLEFKPVQPDVFVERAGPLSAGKDPILEAGLTEAAKLAKRQQPAKNRQVNLPNRGSSYAAANPL